MRRLFAAFLLLVSACSGENSTPSLEFSPGSINAQFPTGGATDVLEVTVRDRMAAQNIALVGPGGMTTPAFRIERRQAPRLSDNSAGLTIPILGAPSSVTVSGDVFTDAFVRVPDVIDYRKNWRDYRIRVEAGTPPNALRAVSIPAPPPP